MNPIASLTPLDFLTQGVRAGELQVEVEYGLDSIALVRCCGEVSAATLPRLNAAIESATKCEYTTIVFDFTFCSCDEQILKHIFSEAIECGVTVLSTTMITRMANYWGCPVAEAFRKLTGRTAAVDPLDNGKPINPPAQSDPNMKPVDAGPVNHNVS